MLEAHKDRYHVKLDACRDPFIRCAPTAGRPLDEASLFDDGPTKWDCWVFDTQQPNATAGAIMRKLERHGIKSAVSQIGEQEVIVRMVHGGDLDVQRVILKTLHADRKMELSPEVVEKRREQCRKMNAMPKRTCA